MIPEGIFVTSTPSNLFQHLSKKNIDRYPGSVPDSVVYENSYAKVSMQQVCDGFCLLADKGFRNTNQVLTPYRENERRRYRAARRFNSAHQKTRVIIEQTFGVLKRKFRILQEIRMEPERAAKLITGVCSLYQLMIRLGETVPRIYGPRRATIRHPPANVRSLRTWLANNL